MRFFQRRAVLIWLMLVVLGPAVLAVPSTTAQEGDAPLEDNDTIIVRGSGIVARVFEALRTASGVEAAVELSVTGTNAGLQGFCAGEADAALANRALSSDEEAACSASAVNFVELEIANDVLAFITHADNPATCLAEFDLDAALAPSARGTAMNWGFIGGDASLDMPVFLPPQDSPVYAYLDRLVDGDGLRTDAVIDSNDSEVISSVADTPGALGVVALASVGDERAVKVLELNNLELSACYKPSAENVEERRYAAGDRLFLYVNAESLAKPGLTELLNFIASDDAPAVVTEAGFTPPSAAAYTQLGDILANTTTGRVFSLEVTSFTIPQGAAGTVTIQGAAFASQYVQSMVTLVTQNYPGLTITPTFEGEPAGFRALCNGEVDIVIASGGLTEEQQTNCEANSVVPLTFDLGKQVVVFLASTSSDYLACVKTDQLYELLRARAEEDLPKTWNQVTEGLPEDPIFVFGPSASDSYTDLLMSRIGGKAAPIRSDIQVSNDVLYRAAATANVKGGLAYMTWGQYQAVLENEQANIQLVAVDYGNGCVAPSTETISDGTYPLTRSAKLIVKKASLTNIAVQSWLWSLFMDANYAQFENAGFYGLDFASLDEIRDSLEQAFAEAAEELAAAQPTSEAPVDGEPTPESTAEVTPEEPTEEPTEESTAEATEEPTEEPTEESTAEATEEPTEEPTVAPTEEPTEEPTVEPTAEPTEEPTAAATEAPTEEATPEPTATGS